MTKALLTLGVAAEAVDEFARVIADAVVERVVAVAAPDWLDSRDAAEYLRISLDSLHRLTAAKHIPHRKLNGRCLFLRTELQAWLDGFYEGPPRAQGRRR